MRRGLVRTSYGHIHYREAGVEGPRPAIVLLHINQQSSALMTELIEALAPHRRAIAIDYPGHGMSDHLALQPTIPDYARCVTEVLDALGVGSFTALGEATGAAVSVALATAAPQRVERAVLVNCPLLEKQVADGLLEAFNAKLRPADASGFGALRTIDYMLREDPDHAPLRPTQSWMDRINRAQAECGRDRWQALSALISYDLGAALGRVQCPVLLLTGEQFYFRHRVPEIEKRVRNLTSEVLAGARFCATWEMAVEIARRGEAFREA